MNVAHACMVPISVDSAFNHIYYPRRHGGANLQWFPELIINNV